MTRTIDDFDFGIAGKLELPEEEPPHTEWLLFTAWHINRALGYIQDGRENYTIPHIFSMFKVRCPSVPPRRPANVQQELKVVRAIQPFVRVKNGEVEPVRIRPPKKSREQACILLYALLPGEEGQRCSCCAAHGGSGPFALCIPRRGRWSDGACLNCWFTGTSNKCQLRRGKHFPGRDPSTPLTAVEHDQAARESMQAKQGNPLHFAEGEERQVHPADLEQWLVWIEREQLDRALRKRRLEDGD